MSKKNRFTKVTSLFLVFVMVLSMMPMSVFASSTGKDKAKSNYSSSDVVTSMSKGVDALSSSEMDEFVGKKKSSTRIYVCPVCKTRVRATKTVNIGCWDCMEQMVVEEK